MKKPILISIVAGLVIVTAGSTFLITYFSLKKKHEAEKQKYAKWLFETHYADRVSLFKEENKHLSNVDISFVGDSLTEGYDVKTFYPTYNVVNRGIGGDTTFGVENRLDSSVYDVNSKIASLLIGANNFDTMLENYESIVTKIRTNLPSTKLVLCSLTSMTGNWGRNNEKAKNNNIEIKKIAERNSCTFVDLYNPLLDPNTNELKEAYSVDGGHLTASGYEVVTNTLMPIFQSLL